MGQNIRNVKQKYKGLELQFITKIFSIQILLFEKHFLFEYQVLGMSVEKV